MASIEKPIIIADENSSFEKFDADPVESAPGAEEEPKSAAAEKPGWLARLRFVLLTLALILAVLAGFERWLHTAEMFVIRDVVITGYHYVLEDEILDAMHLSEQTNIFRISLEGMQKRIKTIPRVQAAVVLRGLPDKLLVNVEERVPVMLTKIGDRFYEVDAEGVILPPLNKGLVVDLPLVTGLDTAKLNPGDRISDPLLPAALKIINKFEQIETGWSFQISELHMKSEEDVQIFTMVPGQLVRINMANYETQLERFKLIYDQMGRDQQKVETYDLRFANQVIVRN